MREKIKKGRTPIVEQGLLKSEALGSSPNSDIYKTSGLRKVAILSLKLRKWMIIIKIKTKA